MAVFFSDMDGSKTTVACYMLELFLHIHIDQLKLTDPTDIIGCFQPSQQHSLELASM